MSDFEINPYGQFASNFRGPSCPSLGDLIANNSTKNLDAA